MYLSFLLIFLIFVTLKAFVLKVSFFLANSQGWKHVRVFVCLTRDAHTNDEFTHIFII